MYPTEKGFLQGDLEDAGLSEEDADRWSSWGAIPIAALEGVFEGARATGVGVPLTVAAERAMGRGARKIFSNQIAQWAASSATEGLTESLQEITAIGIQSRATGEAIDWADALNRMAESFAAGAVAGAAFEGGARAVGAASNAMSKKEVEAGTDATEQATFQDESGLSEVLTPDLAAALSAEVANIDAATLEPGTEIAGKYKDANGRWRKLKEDGSRGTQFASAPTTEEIAEVQRQAVTDATAAAGAAVATPTTPLNLSTGEASGRIARIAANPEITPELVQLNINTNSTNYRSSAIKNVNSMEDVELQSKIATLETLATDPESGADYATRVAAMANIRALESAIQTRDSEAGVITDVDTSLGARTLATTMDDKEFLEMATIVGQSGDEKLKKQFAEASAIRANSANLVENASDEVRKRLNKATAAASRGMKPGTSIITSEGQVAKVQAVRPSGFLDATIDGVDGIQLIDPAGVTIVPNAGQSVKLTGGSVATVKEVPQGGSKVMVETPIGADILIDLSSIESVDTVPAIAAQIAEQVALAEETKPEADKVELLEPTTVTNKSTGQTVEVVAAGKAELELADGTTMPRAMAQRPMTDESRFLSNNGGEVPVFSPGTQPAREGNHINFVQVPTILASSMDNLVKRGDAASLTDMLNSLPGSNFTLLPQPQRTGMVTYAIEMPGDARTLTGGSKKTLSFLSGKTNTKPPLASTVKLNREMAADEVAVMAVPFELLMGVSHGDFTGRSVEEQREYLRRLTDLGFENNTPIAEALKGAQEAATTARDLRIDGVDIGGAEMAEIAAMGARAEAAKVVMEQDIAERQAEWEAIKPALRQTMLPREVSTLDLLNRTDEDLLRYIFKEDVQGVGPKLSDKILAARREAGEGGFTNLSELTAIKGLGAPTLANIMEAVKSGVIPETDILTEQHEKELAEFLINLEPRRGDRDVTNWIPSYEHPHIPGMHLVIDKQEIASASSTRGNRRFTREEVRETLGGFVEEEFNGQPIQIDPLDQLDEETLTRLMGGQMAGTRTVYHVSYITPEGAVVKARTISSEERSYRVPAHLGAETIDQRGGARPGRAVAALTKLQAEGGDLAAAVEAMQAQRREVTLVKIEGEETFVEVVEQVTTGDKGAREETSQFVVKDDNGKIFEIEASQIVDSREEVEGDVTVKMPIRWSPEEQAHEVVKMVRGFSPRTRLFTVGEYRSEIPGLYAEIRPTTINVPAAEAEAAGLAMDPESGDVVPTKGFRAMFMEKDDTRVMDTLGLFSPSHIKDFATEEEARAYLSDRGFKRGKTSDSIADMFRGLPPVDMVQETNMELVHSYMSEILKQYRIRGFYPQPVRDYAVRFAIMYNDAGFTTPGGIFRDRGVRKDLKIYNPAELTSAARDVNNNFSGAITQQPKGSIFFQDGKLALERPTPAELAADIRPMDGILLQDRADLASVSTAAALYEQTEHRMRFLDMIEHNGEPIEHATQERLVEVGREKRLGVILESNPSTGRMIVQIWRNGEPVTIEVRDKDVKRLRSPDKLRDYLRVVKDNMGDLTNLPATPPIGTSPIDKMMGLDGVTDRASYADGLRKKVGEIFLQVKVNPDGTVTGDTSLMKPLAKIWIRMRELEIPNQAYYVESLDPEFVSDFDAVYGNNLSAQTREVKIGEPRQAKRSKAKEFFNEDGTRTVVEDTTAPTSVVGSNTELQRTRTLFPPQLIVPSVLGGIQTRGIIPELAHEEIASTFSAVSAYGELMAKAKLGWLDPSVQKQIMEHAEKFGVSTDGPFYQVVERMIQNVWDPNVANSMFGRRREIDLQTFATGIPTSFKHGIEVRQPATGHQLQTVTAFGALFAFPRTLANRHPTIKTFFTLLERLRHDHVQEVKELDEVLMGANRYNKEQKLLIRDMWESEELGAAMSRPSDILSEPQFRAAAPLLAEQADKAFPNERWYDEYLRTRQQIVKIRRWNIRNGLFRGFHAKEIEFKSDNPNGKLDELRVLRKDNALTEQEYLVAQDHVKRGGKVYDLDRVSNPAFAHPQSQIDRFLDLTDDYASFADIPLNIRTEMATYKDKRGEPWMIDEFDFWARYGMNNYAPRILQGRHKIKIPDPDGGADITVAVAPDGQAAQKFFFDVSRGRYEGIDPSAVNGMYIDIGKARGDDLDAHFLGPTAFAKFYSEMVKEFGGPTGKATEMARAAVKALNLGSERAAPRDLHMQARVADLQSLIEDPYKALKIYHDRTSRNNFLLNVNDAYNKAQAMDHSLSIGSGVMPIFDNDRSGATGQKAAAWYMENLRDNAMGQAPGYEKVLSNAIALASFDVSRFLTPSRIKAFRERASNPSYDFFQDHEIFPLLYNEDFTLREVARKWNKFQTVFRLGFNIGGSLINMTQNAIYTPSNLMSHGYGVKESYGHMAMGYMKSWQYMLPGLKTDPKLTAFFESIGLDTDAISGSTGGMNLRKTFTVKKARFIGEDKVFSVGGKDLVNFSALSDRFVATAMLPFGAAENLTRRAAAIAAKDAAESTGRMTPNAVELFTREHINDTQFQYFDMALPPYMKGSLARIALQFAHFPANALKYEKDLFMGAEPPLISTFSPRAGELRGSRTVTDPWGNVVPAKDLARKALASHMAIIGLTGGLVGLALRPEFAPISWMIQKWAKAFGDNDEGDIEQWYMNQFGRGYDAAIESPAEGHVGDPELWEARNFMHYGAPGLLGLQLSQRMSVTGLDVNPSKWDDLLFGPTGGMYRDVWAGLYGQDGFATVNPKAAGIGAAAAILGSRLNLPIPHKAFGTAVAGAALASEFVGPASLRQFTDGTVPGRNLKSSVLPTLVSATMSAQQIFSNPSVYDRNLVERSYGTAFNKAFEAGTGLMAFQPIRTAEERALASYIRTNVMLKAARTRAFTDMIATSMNNAGGMTNKETADLYAAALAENLYIDPEKVAEARRARAVNPIQKAIGGVSRQDRDQQQFLPRGQRRDRNR